MGIKEGLLALLADGPRHGYQLKLDLEAATGDAVTINVGQVNTTLQRLERDGLVEDGRNDVEGEPSIGSPSPGSRRCGIGIAAGGPGCRRTGRDIDQGASRTLHPRVSIRDR